MAPADRLVDYFVVAAYDRAKVRSPTWSEYSSARRRGATGRNCNGYIVQRFPIKDWPDTPFIDGLEHFCQPNGWRLSLTNFEPRFHISVLTDIKGNRHFCACLTFGEAISRRSLSGHHGEQGRVETEESTGDIGDSHEDLKEDDEADEDDEDGMGAGASDAVLARLKREASCIERRHHSIPSHVPGVSFVSGHEDVVFAPKCLVVLSRHDLPEVLRSCLCVIYTVYSESLVGVSGEKIRLEQLVGNLLGSVLVPSPGQSHAYFSLGASDKILVQPPLRKSVPITGERVACLFLQLGIQNVVDLVMSAMTEQKILFFSKSYSRLTDGCMALVSLMYPFKYTHVFIPILPSALIEVLSTPTPFIIGLHSSKRNETQDHLLDVITVDLDGGAIQVPENLKLFKANEALLHQLRFELSLVLKPDLEEADLAFPDVSGGGFSEGGSNPWAQNQYMQHQHHCNPRSVSNFELDKQLRAVVLRFFTRLMHGYRSCLTIVRIHPECFITFHKAAFLGINNSHDYEFLKRFLGSMFFGTFVSERGPPWRQCDVYDLLQSRIAALEKEECDAVDKFDMVADDDDNLRDVTLLMEHIQNLSQELCKNEDLSQMKGQNQYQNIPKPPAGAIRRVHQPIFPRLDEAIVTELTEKYSKLLSTPPVVSNALKEVVPVGELGEGSAKPVVSNSTRRLLVLRKCVHLIFDNRVSDARKTFPAVLCALKTVPARISLCNELDECKGNNHQVLLEHQQFEMVVRLMNAALQDDSDMDEHGIACRMMPLSSVFCRKLSHGVIQYVYTLIQDHAVWQNQQFWEASFYRDVQNGIEALYSDSSSQMLSSSSDEKDGLISNRSSEINNNKNVLEITAKELHRWHQLDDAEKQRWEEAEEKVIYSQIFDYTTRMVSLLCPMEVERGSRKLDDMMESASNSISNSVAESDSIDAESGFEDQETVEKGQNVIKFILRFADKVCSETRVTEDHAKSVSQMIRCAVPMHIEMLEAVTAQALKLPAVLKSKIVPPRLLRREELLTPNGLRAFLISDGREKGLPFLPAEGALFLTTYRIVFTGSPLSTGGGSEAFVCRFFPISSLTKEKRFSINQYLTEIEQHIKEGFQLRSNTFQLMRLAFDDEVHGEEIEAFRKNVQQLRFPETVLSTFAFRSSRGGARPSYVNRNKKKGGKNVGTIRGIASKTIKSVSKAAGLRDSKGVRNTLRMISGVPDHGMVPSSSSDHNIGIAGTSGASFDPSPSSANDGETRSKSNGLLTMSVGTRTLEHYKKTNIYFEWQRLGFLPSDGHRIGQPYFVRASRVNSAYSVSPSYPSLLLVPSGLTDDSLKRYARFHRQSRFPVITWRHSKNSSVLLRGASFHGRGVIGMIRRHQDGGGVVPGNQAALPSQVDTTMTHAVEAETVFGAIVHTIHNLAGTLSTRSHGFFDGEMMLPGYSATLTPQTSKKIGSMMRIQESILTSGSHLNLGRLSFGNLKLHQRGHSGSQLSLNAPDGYASASMSASSNRTSISVFGATAMEKATLYVLVQPHVKGLKLDPQLKVELVPLEIFDTRRLRASFKKLMRATASSSSSALASGTGTSSSENNSFLRNIENSEWLLGLQSLMQISGVVIDLMDVEKASVMVCFEDGWDLTCQVSSIAQLCMDPYYRTLRGFRVLVEKEWLSMGHRFSHRSNLTLVSQDAGYTPVFLQFLDVVHQIHLQFPMAFEFNQFYLRYLAYHHVSCRFNTFLFDSEAQRASLGGGCHSYVRNPVRTDVRLQLGNDDDDNIIYSSDEDDEEPSSQSVTAKGGPSVLESDRSRSRSVSFAADPSYGGGDDLDPGCMGLNLFDHVEALAAKSPIFHNFLYSYEDEEVNAASQSGTTADPEACSGTATAGSVAGDPSGSNREVLRPKSKPCDLAIWSYFITEELKFGPSNYEFDCISRDHYQLDPMSSTLTAPSTTIATSASSSGLMSFSSDQVQSTGHDCIVAGYNCLPYSDTSSFCELLHEIAQLESQLGYLPNPWQMHFDQASSCAAASAAITANQELSHDNDDRRSNVILDDEDNRLHRPRPHPRSSRHHRNRGIKTGSVDYGPLGLMDPILASPSMSSALHSSNVASHKTSTLELLLKSRMGNGGASGSGGDVAGAGEVESDTYVNHHRFEKYNYTTPSTCDFCNGLLWGPKTGLRCSDCGYNCHEKCRENSPKSCSKKFSSIQDASVVVNSSVSTSASTAMSVSAVAAAGAAGLGSAVPRVSELQSNLTRTSKVGVGDVFGSTPINTFHRFSPGTDENSQIVYQGYLYKQANFRIKGWKQRWFVLDSIKHQIRYYDTREDFRCKGQIDLSDVLKITEGSSVPGAPKKADDRCFFELHTSKRNYCFCADSPQAAQEWIVKIQNCIQ